VDIDRYLNRIQFRGDISLNEECLIKLHSCHIMSIPFEALDIHLNRQISLDLVEIYNKVINNNRGGYCYELNLLFHNLLRELGFESHLISASIHDGDSWGPEYDHMAILVRLESTYLVDVLRRSFYRTIKAGIN